MKAKPTLGMCSLTTAVQALRDDGVPAAAIARRLDLGSARRVTALEQERHRRTVHLTKDVMDLLAPYAEQRGVSPSRLARQIVTIAVYDELVDAVLDDRA